MSKAIRTLAQDQDIPVLTCLEGGYNLEALAAAVQATIEVFAEA
jgi:acetoin utilization deacetylase AcuC-like enzyme